MRIDFQIYFQLHLNYGYTKLSAIPKTIIYAELKHNYFHLNTHTS